MMEPFSVYGGTHTPRTVYTALRTHPYNTGVKS